MILMQTFVAGEPKTKGSMRIRNRATGALAESVAGSSTWRALMAGAVRDAYRDSTRADTWRPPYTGAVFVQLMFVLPVDPLREGAGDLDKLTRNVLDALGMRSKNPRYNGGVIIDDNQVCRIKTEKWQSVSLARSGTGVFITVETM